MLGPLSSIYSPEPGASCQTSSQRKPPSPTKWNGRMRYTMIPVQGSPAHPQFCTAKRGPPRPQVCSSSPFSPKANLARCRKTVCLKATDPSHPLGWSEGHQSLEAGKPALGVRNHNGNGQSRPGEGQWLTQHSCGYYSKTWHRGIHFKPSMWLNLLFGWWSHVFG